MRVNQVDACFATTLNNGGISGNYRAHADFPQRRAFHYVDKYT